MYRAFSSSRSMRGIRKLARHVRHEYRELSGRDLVRVRPAKLFVAGMRPTNRKAELAQTGHDSSRLERPDRMSDSA